MMMSDVKELKQRMKQRMTEIEINSDYRMLAEALATIERLEYERQGKVLVPVEPTFSASVKAECIGEFQEYCTLPCLECLDIGEVDEHCIYCDGTGSMRQPVQVSWTTMKEIYKRLHKAMLQASPEAEQEGGE